ncbi:MAG: fumarylacetoacetate hydrolase family protein, partial [Bryobacterales bacterium]|nr:fumarylacetoacetate hydrolase family protein [Bryobacterales bacterium]
LRRTFEELVDYLTRSNKVPTPTVILTGTGIIVEQEAALKPGDVCSVNIPQIGTLSNPAALV